MLIPSYVENLVAAAIQEDVGAEDITASLIDPAKLATAQIITRESAVICGTAFVDEVFKQLDNKIALQWQVRDGQEVVPNQVLGQLSGFAKNLLTGERTALNFLQTLSATATVTAQYVLALQGTHTKLLDTRKTIPGLRLAQKYAVTCGGGTNHRMGLYDAFLIKENHISACGSIQNAIITAKAKHPGKVIEIEVENLAELTQALVWKADVILLDNFSLEMMHQAVVLNNKQAKLEVSGNVNQQMLTEIAATGVDYISVGAITKHIQAIDLSMRFIA